MNDRLMELAELYGEIRAAHNCAVLIKQRGGDVCSG